MFLIAKYCKVSIIRHTFSLHLLRYVYVICRHTKCWSIIASYPNVAMGSEATPPVHMLTLAGARLGDG